MEEKHNPIIGYILVDGQRRVIGPPETKIDPVFHSKERALAAARGYGRREDDLDTVDLRQETT